MGQGSGIAASCGMGHRHSSVPSQITAVALIRPLAWESPYATSEALKRKKKKKKIGKEVPRVFVFVLSQCNGSQVLQGGRESGL